MELTKEEIEFLEARREKAKRDNNVPPRGIGTGREWGKAKIKKKTFIDEATYIEKEGHADNNP